MIFFYSLLIFMYTYPPADIVLLLHSYYYVGTTCLHTVYRVTVWYTKHAHSHFFHLMVYLFKFWFLEFLNILEDHNFKILEYFCTTYFSCGDTNFYF